MKDKIQLAINKTIARVVTSSMKVLSEIFITFKEAKRIKQIPNRLEEAFNICGDFSRLFTLQLLKLQQNKPNNTLIKSYF